jgi:putative protein-disulfide isomerase
MANINLKKNEVDHVEIIYYTDPLCCWSWAMEPQWRRLLHEYDGKISWKYCMGGLIPDWNTYNDPFNSISRPLQMGPLWFEARHISGQPINEKIWMTDPPKSSYPSCIAFKTVEMQSFSAADEYLRLLREAVMLNEKNISRYDILLEIASLIKHESFDFKQFETELKKNSGVELFKNDLQNTKLNKIGRFPTFIIRNQNGTGVIIVGYRPYDAFVEAIKQVVPAIVACI